MPSIKKHPDWANEYVPGRKNGDNIGTKINQMYPNQANQLTAS
jgi:hypothetical protein